MSVAHRFRSIYCSSHGEKLDEQVFHRIGESLQSEKALARTDGC